MGETKRRKKCRCKVNMTENDEYLRRQVRYAWQSQERWRQKQIHKFYISGRPIFQSDKSVKRCIKKMGYETNTKENPF